MHTLPGRVRLSLRGQAVSQRGFVMNRAVIRALPRLPGLLSLGGVLAVLAVLSGCARRIRRALSPPPWCAEPQPDRPEMLPVPKGPAHPALPPAATIPVPARAVPINLDTVAPGPGSERPDRHRPRKAATSLCPPGSGGQGPGCRTSGSGWHHRHEGGIQDFNGNLIKSSYGSMLGGVQLNGVMDLRKPCFGSRQQI